jgi:hypothetical protein
MRTALPALSTPSTVINNVNSGVRNICLKYRREPHDVYRLFFGGHLTLVVTNKVGDCWLQMTALS